MSEAEDMGLREGNSESPRLDPKFSDDGDARLQSRNWFGVVPLGMFVAVPFELTGDFDLASEPTVIVSRRSIRNWCYLNRFH